MPRTLSLLLRALTLAALAASAPLAADAPPPDFLADFVFPPGGGAPADEVFVLYADHCGRPHPDPRRAARIVRSDARIEVDLYLVENPAEICLAVLSPSTLVPYSIGTLPPGHYEIVRRLHLRHSDGTEYRPSTVSWARIQIGDVPQPAVSGAWHDPEEPGSGLFLNLLPGASGTPDGTALLHVLTREGDAAVWVAGTGQFVEGVLRVPLQGPQHPAGTGRLVFEYLGCNAARVRIEGDWPLAFPRDGTRLQQLTRTGGLPDCHPPRRGPLAGQ